MSNYKKILIISLFVVFLTFILVTFTFAQRRLEVPIPGLPTATLPALPDYIAAIFRFIVIVFGIICFGALVYGGFRYLTSAGSPTVMADAKDQIFSALLGMIILFSAWLILNTINPELVILGEPGKELIGPMPGAYPFVMRLYKDADYQGDKCDIGKSDKWIEDLCGAGWDNEISSIKIEDPTYVMVIHEHINYVGKAQLIETNISRLDAHLNDQTSSITLIKKSGGSGKAILYDAANFKGSSEYPVAVDFFSSNRNFSEITVTTEDGTTRAFNNKASSITVEKNVIAILYNYISYKGWGRIIAKNDPTFNTCDDEDWCQDCAEVIGWPHCDCLARALGDSCWEDKPSSIQVVYGTIVLLEGFPERQVFPIQGQWWAGKGYVVPIRVEYGPDPGGTHDGIAYVDGKSQADFDDIRFTDNNSSTLLNYWLQEKVDGNYAIFWVKVEDDLSDPVLGNPWNTEIYMVYGNSTAGSVSNPFNTFMFFEDFDADKGWWTYTENGASWSGAYSGGRYQISYPSATASSVGYYGRITSKKFTIPGMPCPWLTPIRVELQVEDSYTGATSGYHFKQVYFDGGFQWEDDVEGNEGVISITRDFSVCSGDKDMYLQVYDKLGVSNFGVTAYWDNLRIRRYVSPEPVVGTPY